MIDNDIFLFFFFFKFNNDMIENTFPVTLMLMMFALCVEFFFLLANAAPKGK